MLIKTLKIILKGEMKEEKSLKLRNKKLILNKIKLLGKHVLTQIKVNKVNQKKEGGRGRETGRSGREVMALPVKRP